MIRKRDLDHKTSLRPKRSVNGMKRPVAGVRKKYPPTHPDGSGYEDVILARRRGVFGTALLFLAILMLVVVI